jgi:hypothetical protein
MRSRVNFPDLAFAAFLVGLGAFAFALAAELPVGSATQMGPGYVPRGLAMLIMAFGVVMGGRTLLVARQEFPAIAWRPLILISVSVAVFAVLLPLAGLAVLAFGLAAFAVALFVLALGLPIPIWPPR